MTKNISIKLLDFNKGQLAGLPKNPRFFRDYRFEAMKKSISDSPEMLDLRELIVFPSEGRYIVVCGVFTKLGYGCIVWQYLAGKFFIAQILTGT